MKKASVILLSSVQGLLNVSPYLFVLNFTGKYNNDGVNIAEESIYAVIIIWTFWQVNNSLNKSTGFLDFVMNSRFTTAFLSFAIVANWRHDMRLLVFYIFVSIGCGAAAFLLRRLEVSLRESG